MKTVEINSAAHALKNQIEAQRSGFDLERRHSEMSELSPKAEAKDMELVLTMARWSSG